MEPFYLGEYQTYVSTWPSAYNRTSADFKGHLVNFSITFTIFIHHARRKATAKYNI